MSLFSNCQTLIRPSTPQGAESTMSMPETAGQRAVRITLFNSGLSPPVFILSNFTDPPWEPHEMSYVEDRRVDKSKPSQRPVEYLFWGRFDIYPGVWLYKYQIGHDNWLIYDHQAEMSKGIPAQSSKHKLMCSPQRKIAQAKSSMSLESKKRAPHSLSHPRHFRSLGAGRHHQIQALCPGRVPGRIP